MIEREIRVSLLSAFSKPVGNNCDHPRPPGGLENPTEHLQGIDSLSLNCLRDRNNQTSPHTHKTNRPASLWGIQSCESLQCRQTQRRRWPPHWESSHLQNPIQKQKQKPPPTAQKIAKIHPLRDPTTDEHKSCVGYEVGQVQVGKVALRIFFACSVHLFEKENLKRFFFVPLISMICSFRYCLNSPGIPWNFWQRKLASWN